MEDFSAFLTIAEVSVAFAGFSALAGVIGSAENRNLKFDLEKLRNLVFISLLVVGCALIPIVVENLGVAPDRIWQVSSCIAFVLNLLVLIQAIRKGNESSLHSEDKYYTLIGYGIEIFIEAALILGMLNLFPGAGMGLYLAFLVFALFQAGTVFLLLVTSIIEGRTKPQDRNMSDRDTLPNRSVESDT